MVDWQSRRPCWVFRNGLYNVHFDGIASIRTREASMSTTAVPTALPGRSGGLLDRDRIIAGPGFNRWLVPPAALAIHLCIGMAYGFSVFWLPPTKAAGIPTSVP